jgi:5-methylthioadenosine/S-adenosylhomocysteine deaminase
MKRVLIKNGWLIPMAGAEEVVVDGAVAFDNGRITYVGKSRDFDAAKFKPDTVVDARGKAILPGLVNTHTHLVGAYIKAITEDVRGPAGSGLFKRALPLQVRHVKREDMYWGGMVHAMEMVMTGTTTINETWWHQKELAPVVRDIGLRAVISEMVVETDLSEIRPDVPERRWNRGLFEQGYEAAIELYEEWEGKENGRITTRIAPGGPGYVSDAGLVRCRDLAEKQGVGLHIHFAEIPGETEFMLHRYSKRPVALMRDLGMLGQHVIGIHCVFLDDDDIQIMAETGTKFSHTAFHVPKRGYFPPMPKVYKAGIDVSLGSDWCSNDLWNFMRAAILIPRVLTGDVGAMSGYDALRMATMGGARCLGLEKEIGSLEIGKKADIILVDMTRPSCNPIRLENICTNLVYNANGSDVTHVFVDGRLVVEDREMKTVDRHAMLREAQSRAERIWGEAFKGVS